MVTRSHTKCSLLAIPLYSYILHTHTTHTVTNLKALNITNSSATITWDQPPHNYRVFLQGEATDKIPQSRVIPLVDVTGQTTHIVEGLNSFRNYSISVFLAADNGNGSVATVIVRTTGRGKERVCCVNRRMSLYSLNMNKGRVHVRMYTKPLKNYALVRHHTDL